MRAGCCSDCRHFQDQPAALEAVLPGLSSFSSAYASVRSDDGICVLHDRYVAASGNCAGHVARLMPAEKFIIIT